MRTSLKRTVVGSLTALAIGVSAIGVTTPASAQVHHFSHGGGAHGGAWRGGGGHWHGGGWGPAAVGLGVLGLAGAAIATQGAYGYDNGYGDCQAYRPVYDAYGNYMGRRLVNVC
ncbi:hypothetical protein [Methylocapsa sp. S129]|uniref:hypothetical protein n=1 Tax=Methylocapsa sp. S129 TaxID=1641869 RepID=UPI00131B4F5A|nr:hypothetical protein [Methylocapsa sp. S129]